MEQSVLTSTMPVSEAKKTARFIGKTSLKVLCGLFFMLIMLSITTTAKAQGLLMSLSLTANGNDVPLSPSFDPFQFSYAGNVTGSGTVPATISYQTLDPPGFDNVTINGGSSPNINLNPGINVITIVVSQSGQSTTYTVTVGVYGTSVTAITAVSSSPTNATSLNFNVNFSNAVSGLTPANFSLANSGTASGVVSSVTGSGTAYTVTINNVTGDGTIGLNLTDPTGITPTPPTPFIGDTYSVKHSIPFVQSIVPAGANPTNSSTPAFTVTFSDPVTGVDPAAFTAVGNGVSASVQSVVQVSSTVYTVVVNASGTGTLGLNLNSSAPEITDVAGNTTASGFTHGGLFNIDNIAPVLSNISYVSNDSGGPLVAATGDVLSLAFTASEATKIPVVTIAGHNISPTSADNINWTASYTLLSTDTRGRAPFSVQAADLYNNLSSSYTDVTQNIDIELGGTGIALSALSVDQGTLSPVFSAGNIAYTDTVANNVAIINITATPSDPSATVSINNTTPAPVSLNIGNNIIPVTVTSADGTITGNYVITVTRSSLVPSISSFSPQSGAPGTVVTINGVNLSSLTSFTIGGVNAITISNNGSTLVGMVMPNAVTGNIGVTTANGTGTSGGSFTVTATPAPTQQQGSALIGTNAVGTSYQGQSVAISADGNTAVVGGPSDNNGVGAAWVYILNNGVWTQQGQKLAPSDGSYAQFGYWCTLSADGNTALFGGPYDNGGAGAIWVFTRSNGVWAQQGAKLTGTNMSGKSFMGWTVGLSADGNTAVTGGPRDNGQKGAVWIFTRSNGVWTQQGAKITATNGSGNPSFGNTTISADGQTIMIGGPGDSGSTGALWVYTLNNGTWTQQGPKLVPSDASGFTQAGYAVALSADGNTAVVGGDVGQSSVGSIWIYTRSGTTWTQQGTQFFGSGDSGGYQGFPVAISADGSVIAEAGYFDNNRTGAYWVFTKNGSGYTQVGSKVTPLGYGGNSYFGTGLSLTPSGNSIFAGAFNASAAFAFEPAIPPTVQASDLNFSNIATHSTTAAWANGNGTSRAVFISQSSSGTPSLTNNTTYNANAAFGSGDQAGSSGWYCVYNGTGSSVNITGLSGNTTYNVMVVEYDGIPGAEQYLTSAASGNQATVTTLGSPTASNITFTSNNANPAIAVVGNTMTLSFTASVAIQAPTVSIEGNGVTATNTSGNSWTATYVIKSTDSKGRIPFSLQFNDLAGSASTTYTDQTQSIDEEIKSSDATLFGLSISNGTLSSSFSSSTTAYSANVGYGLATMTVTPTVNDAGATVTVNGIGVTSGMPSGYLTLAVGANTVPIVVTAADGTQKTYTLTVNEAHSSNNNLSGLTLSGVTLSPSFTAANTSYSAAVAVANTVSSINVTATAADPTASIKINTNPATSGTAYANALAVGTNTITIAVTAQNNAVKTYTVTVTRLPDVTLQNLTVSNGALSPSTFVPATTSYTDNVGNGLTTMTISPVTNDPLATFTIAVNGTPVTSGPPSGYLPLVVGANTVTIVVTGQDHITTKTYTLTVNEARSSNNNLSALAVANATVTPVFSSGVTSYTGNVNILVTNTSVTPTVADATATVTQTANGVPVTVGSSFALNAGTNTIITTVTAQNGAVKTYTVTINRLSDANLSNLILSNGTLNTTFSPLTTSYSTNVGNGLTTMTITPTAEDPNATIIVNTTPVPTGTATAYLPLVVGANTETITVTSADGSNTQTYTLTINEARSANNNLSWLTTSAGTLSPSFFANTVAYTISVPTAVTDVTLTPTLADATASIVETANGTTVSTGGDVPLSIGANTIVMTVTAQNTTTKTYTVTVSRQPDVNLSGIAVSNGSLTHAFSPMLLTYTDNVGNGLTTMTITPTAEDPTSNITVNGTPVPSGTATAYLPLVVGHNTETIIVSSADGSVSQTYTLTINEARCPNDNLTKLILNSGTLSPTFKGSVITYTANVPNTVASITVTPTASVSSETIVVNGTIPVTSGTASPAIPLSVGDNVITVLVTAQTGVNKTYTITVTQAPPPSMTGIYQPVSVEKPTNTPTLKDDGINVHQAISPNGDGIDDYLQIDNINQYPDNNVKIMNRNGQLVYEAKGYDNATKTFDGHSNKTGQMQLPGTYFYQLDYTVNGTTKHKTGFLVLKY